MLFTRLLKLVSGLLAARMTKQPALPMSHQKRRLTRRTAQGSIKPLPEPLQVLFHNHFVAPEPPKTLTSLRRSIMDKTSTPTPLRHWMKVCAAFLIAIVLIANVNAYVALAQGQAFSPKTMNFEGYLADSTGAPITGAHNLVFTIYDAATGGASVWTQSYPSVNVSNGLYSVQLGSDSNPLTPATFNGQRWIEIKVDNVAMAPRIQINAVPWSLNAITTQQLQGNPISTTTPTTGQALVWNGTNWAPSSIANGNATSLQGNALASTAPLDKEVLSWNSTTSQWEPSACTLQGRTVSSAAPTNGQGLIWNSTTTKWEPGTISNVQTFPQLASVGNNASPQNFFANYRSGAVLTFASTTSVNVSAGEVMINGYMRKNTTNVTVGFAPSGLSLGLDTGGTAQINIKYYVYAVADNTGISNFELIISTSSSTPIGKTNFRKLGWFRTMESSANVMAGSVANVVENDVTFTPSTRVYNSAAISIPATSGTLTYLTFNSERFDTDNIHSTTTSPGRLTAQTAGIYLIFATYSYATNPGSTGGSGDSIRLNGTTTIVEGRGYLARVRGHIETVFRLAAGDYVEFGVCQNSGAAIN